MRLSTHGHIARGGHRYFRFRDGTWGRLPTTTVVIPLEANNNVAARDEFRAALEQVYVPTHITVGDGRNCASFAVTLQSWQVPDYAKQRVTVGVRRPWSAFPRVSGEG